MKPPIFHRNFRYDRRLLPNAYLASLETGVHTVEEAREKTGATIGYPGWGLLYHLLLSHLDPQRNEVIIETGTNWGCTTIILAQALIDAGGAGTVITFELEADNVRRAQSNLAAAGVADRVMVVEGNSHINLPRILSEQCRPKSVRFAFLDASHLEHDLLAEFESVRRYLADDAIVAMDNTYQIAEPHEDQRVNGALRQFPQRYGGNLINMEFVSWYTPGLCLWQLSPNLGESAPLQAKASAGSGRLLSRVTGSLRFFQQITGRLAKASPPAEVAQAISNGRRPQADRAQVRRDAGTSVHIGRDSDFRQLVARNPSGAFNTDDLQLLPVRYPGETMPEGMQWGSKQLGNLFVLENVRRSGAKRILEIGPGFNFYFPNHLPAYCDYTSLDASGFYSPELLAMMKARLPRGKAIDGLIGGSTGLLDPDSFDACISVSVIEHLPLNDIRAACMDMFRITAPGGWSLHALDLLWDKAGDVGGLWQTELSDAGFFIDPDSVDLCLRDDWHSDPPHTEPISIMMRFSEGYRSTIWSSDINQVGQQRQVTVLIAARKL